MVKTIAEKLHLKPGNPIIIIGATPELRALLDPLPDATSVVEVVSEAATGVAILFAFDRVTLDERLAEVLPYAGQAKAVWIAYPKGNRTDINRDSIWRRVEELGWTLNANVSFDDTWSAVRAKPKTV